MPLLMPRLKPRFLCGLALADQGAGAFPVRLVC